LTVVVVSILLFSLLGRPAFIWLVISRIVFIPVVAGVAYELIRFTAKNMHNPIVRAIIIPNLLLQHLTTNEPDLSMIEVAIVAFKRVLLAENVITAEEAAVPAPTMPQTDVPETSPLPVGD